MTTSLKRIIAVLVPSPQINAFIIEAKHIVTQMTGNKYFPSPTPALAAVTAHIDALNAAQVAMQSQRSIGARNAAYAVVLADLHALKAYVQQVADANPVNAPSIIISAGFAVKRPTSRHKPSFEVRQGDVSGLARLLARSLGKRVVYFWQLSEDDKQTWKMLPETLAAETSVSGLTPGKTYYFRFRVTTKDGQMNWSDAVSLLVK